MYEELIKQLREEGNWLGFTERLRNLFNEAADAIEELQQIVEHYKGCSDDWYKEACDYKAAIPRWIPVTERLPEKFKDVLTYGKYGIMVDKYIGKFCGEDAFGLALHNTTHWMPLPEPPKEET